MSQVNYPQLQPSSIFLDGPALAAFFVPLVLYFILKVLDPAAFFVFLLKTFLQPRTIRFYWSLDCRHQRADKDQLNQDLLKMNYLRDFGEVKELDALAAFATSFNVNCILRQFWFYFTLDLTIKLVAFAFIFYTITRLNDNYLVSLF